MSSSTLMPLFSSRPMVKLLSIFLMHPEERFYQQELQRMTGESLRPLQLGLGKLERSGLIEKRREGRNAYYKAVPQHPAFADLQSLFRKTFAIGDVLREPLEALCDRVDAAFVFGSMAGGEARPESDVDVLVIGGASLREVSDALADAQESIGREINLAVYEPHEYRARLREDDHFVREVTEGPKMWLVGGPDELERLGR